MPSSEEIREGVVEIFNRWANGFDPLFSKEKRVEKIFEYLYSQGVVIWHEETLTTEPLIKE